MVRENGPWFFRPTEQSVLAAEEFQYTSIYLLLQVWNRKFEKIFTRSNTNEFNTCVNTIELR